MHHRSQNLRSFRVVLARWSIALLPLCIFGCQNNTERDLIARDRRAEEDQLYAMGDYISQYQQLVCQYRSENALLRRQLASRAGTTVTREPPLIPSGPRTNTTPPSSLTPQGATPKLDVPDVPPLNQGTRVEPQGHAAGATLASYNEPAAGAAEQPDVLLSGEVIENSGRGARLVVDVEPFDQSGRVSAFNGEVTLVLVTSDGHGGQRNAAKWDFRSDDVRAAAKADESDRTMQFRVELPAGTQISGATELWARLTPADGKKLISHAALDLSRPGVFSSRTDKLWPSEESVIAASYVEEPSAPIANETAAPINEGTWATAQPGQIEKLSSKPQQPEAAWRPSTEVIPALTGPVGFKTPPPESRTLHSDSGTARAIEAPAVAEAKPAWSPERGGTPVHVARPSWSATR